MKKLLFPILLLIAVGSIYVGYKKFGNIVISFQHPLTVFSEDTPAILQVSNLSTQWSKLSETNILWKELFNHEKNIDLLNTIDKISIGLEKHAKLCQQIDKSPSCFAFFPNESSFNFTFAASVGNSSESEINLFLNSIGFQNANIKSKPTRITNKDLSVYVLLKKQLLVISNNESNIQSAERNINAEFKLNLDKNFQKLLTTTETGGINLFFKPSKFSSALKTKASWFGLETKFKSNEISFSGFSTKTDSIEHYSSTHIDLFPAIPANVNFFNWVGYESFYKHKKLDEDNILITNMNTFFKSNAAKDFDKWIDNQHAYFYIPNQKEPIVVCVDNGSDNALTCISKYAISDSVFTLFGSTKVTPLNTYFNTAALFGENAKQTKSYFFLLNGFGYFAPNLSAVGQILSAINTTKTLNNSEQFLKSNATNFNNKATWFLFCTDTKKHIETLKAYGLPNNLALISSFIGWQKKSNQNQLLFHHILFKKYNPTTQSNNEDNLGLIEVELDTTIRRTPWTTNNHRTSNKELLVETKSNTLYRVTASGEIKWSLKIDGEIIGEIQEIDVLNNKKVQTIFNTKSSIYLLDINGNSVKGFPIKLPQLASNSLSILDYDKTKDYRFIIGLDNGKVVSFNKQGTKVDGWNFTSNMGNISGSIRHIRIGLKDYICMTTENGNVIVLDRRGSSRLEVQNKTGSGNNIILKGKSIQTSKVLFSDSLNMHYIMQFDGTKKALLLDSNFTNSKVRLINYGANGHNYLAISDNNTIHLFDWQFGLKKIIPHGLNANLSAYFYDNGKHYFSLSNGGNYTLINEHSEIVLKTTSNSLIYDLNMDQNPVRISISKNQLFLKHIR